MSRTRKTLALAAAIAVGASGLALADGAGENTSTTKVKVTPNKLSKKKFSKVRLNSGVATRDTADPDGTIPLPPVEEVYIDYDDDIKISFRGIPECDVVDTSLSGTTTAQALTLCGTGSRMSVAGTASNPQKGGKASAMLPSPTGPHEFTDIIVTAFRSQRTNGIILHAFSPTLTSANTQVVQGKIINSPLGGDFGKRLSVPDAPDLAGDVGSLTLFEATLNKGVKARCHDGNKKFNVKANFVYDDDTEDNARASQSCTVKRRR